MKPRSPAIRRYLVDCLKVDDYYFGLISMIGGPSDMDMQYDAVSEELKIYNQFEVDISSVFSPLMEESTENEDDSDFEELPLDHHPSDDMISEFVISRVHQRIKKFTRDSESISNYPLRLIEDAILTRRMNRTSSIFFERDF